MKLRLKVLLFIILSTAIIYIVSVGYINFRYWDYTREMSIQIADLYTNQSAITAQSVLNADMKIVDALENVFLGYSKIEKKTRESVYGQILQDVLANNSNFLAVWMSWELNAIDVDWALPYGRKRTVSYWESGNIISNVDSANLEGDVPGSSYFLMKTGREENLLTDPYFYSYTNDTGSTFLETSLAKGIFIGDRFVGAVGIDVSLQRFQTLIRDLKPFENSYVLIVSNNGTIVANSNEKFQGKKIDKMFPEYNRFDVMKKIKVGDNFSFEVSYKDGNQNYVSFVPIKIDGSSMPWSLGFVVSTSVITKDIRENSKILVILSIVSLVIISLIIWFVLSMIVVPIEKTTKTLEDLSKGNAQENLKITNTSKDEIGRMSRAVNVLINSLVKTQKFAQEIGKGNLKAEYDVTGDFDVLGHSLIDMRDNLLKAQKEEHLRLEETKRLSWMQNGITEVNEILREKSENFETLSSALLKFLVSYTKSIQGGFYLIEEKDGEEFITLKSAYAFDKKKEMKTRLELGEGLVGRVIKEKRTVNISNLPEGYLYVRSGLGDKSPDNLIIIPLIFEDVVLGAFELAGFNKYEEFDIEFLNQIAVRITSSVSVLLKNLETSNLLKESQLQTATFEMKERQFIRQRKRIAEKQKNMELKVALMDVTLQAVRMLGLYIELDEDKNVVDTNEFLLRALEVAREDIIGKNISEITRVDTSITHWLANFWEDVFKGETRKKNTIYFYGDKELEINEVYFITQTTDSKKVVIIGVK